MRAYGAAHNGRAYRYEDSLALRGLRGKRLERAFSRGYDARARARRESRELSSIPYKFELPGIAHEKA